VSSADAVSIANTYIVFTTIIFVGVTVLLAVAGYVFTQHFSSTKSSQEREILDELKEKVKTDEQVGIKLTTKLLENPDVKRHLSRLLNLKVDEIIRARMVDAGAAAAAAARTAQTVEGLASQLNLNDLNGKGVSNASGQSDVH